MDSNTEKQNKDSETNISTRFKNAIDPLTGGLSLSFLDRLENSNISEKLLDELIEFAVSHNRDSGNSFKEYLMFTYKNVPLTGTESDKFISSVVEVLIKSIIPIKFVDGTGIISDTELIREIFEKISDSRLVNIENLDKRELEIALHRTILKDNGEVSFSLIPINSLPNALRGKFLFRVFETLRRSMSSPLFFDRVMDTISKLTEEEFEIITDEQGNSNFELGPKSKEVVAYILVAMSELNVLEMNNHLWDEKNYYKDLSLFFLTLLGSDLQNSRIDWPPAFIINASKNAKNIVERLMLETTSLDNTIAILKKSAGVTGVKKVRRMIIKDQSIEEETILPELVNKGIEEISRKFYRNFTDSKAVIDAIEYEPESNIALLQNSILSSSDNEKRSKRLVGNLKNRRIEINEKIDTRRRSLESFIQNLKDLENIFQSINRLNQNIDYPDKSKDFLKLSKEILIELKFSITKRFNQKVITWMSSDLDSIIKRIDEYQLSNFENLPGDIYEKLVTLNILFSETGVSLIENFNIPKDQYSELVIYAIFSLIKSINKETDKSNANIKFYFPLMQYIVWNDTSKQKSLLREKVVNLIDIEVANQNKSQDKAASIDGATYDEVILTQDKLDSIDGKAYRDMALKFHTFQKFNSVEAKLLRSELHNGMKKILSRIKNKKTQRFVATLLIMYATFGNPQIKNEVFKVISRISRTLQIDDLIRNNIDPKIITTLSEAFIVEEDKPFINDAELLFDNDANMPTVELFTIRFNENEISPSLDLTYEKKYEGVTFEEIDIPIYSHDEDAKFESDNYSSIIIETARIESTLFPPVGWQFKSVYVEGIDKSSVKILSDGSINFEGQLPNRVKLAIEKRNIIEITKGVFAQELQGGFSRDVKIVNQNKARELNKIMSDADDQLKEIFDKYNFDARSTIIEMYDDHETDSQLLFDYIKNLQEYTQEVNTYSYDRPWVSDADTTNYLDSFYTSKSRIGFICNDAAMANDMYGDYLGLPSTVENLVPGYLKQTGEAYVGKINHARTTLLVWHNGKPYEIVWDATPSKMDQNLESQIKESTSIKDVELYRNSNQQNGFSGSRYDTLFDTAGNVLYVPDISFLPPFEYLNTSSVEGNNMDILDYMSTKSSKAEYAIDQKNSIRLEYKTHNLILMSYQEKIFDDNGYVGSKVRLVGYDQTKNIIYDNSFEQKDINEKISLPPLTFGKAKYDFTTVVNTVKNSIVILVELNTSYNNEFHSIEGDRLDNAVLRKIDRSTEIDFLINKSENSYITLYEDNFYEIILNKSEDDDTVPKLYLRAKGMGSAQEFYAIENAFDTRELSEKKYNERLTSLNFMPNGSYLFTYRSADNGKWSTKIININLPDHSLLDYYSYPEFNTHIPYLGAIFRDEYTKEESLFVLNLAQNIQNKILDVQGVETLPIPEGKDISDYYIRAAGMGPIIYIPKDSSDTVAYFYDAEHDKQILQFFLPASPRNVINLDINQDGILESTKTTREIENSRTNYYTNLPERMIDSFFIRGDVYSIFSTDNGIQIEYPILNNTVFEAENADGGVLFIKSFVDIYVYLGKEFQSAIKVETRSQDRLNFLVTFIDGTKSYIEIGIPNLDNVRTITPVLDTYYMQPQRSETVDKENPYFIEHKLTESIDINTVSGEKFKANIYSLNGEISILELETKNGSYWIERFSEGLPNDFADHELLKDFISFLSSSDEILIEGSTIVEDSNQYLFLTDSKSNFWTLQKNVPNLLRIPINDSYEISSIEKTDDTIRIDVTNLNKKETSKLKVRVLLHGANELILLKGDWSSFFSAEKEGDETYLKLHNQNIFLGNDISNVKFEKFNEVTYIVNVTDKNGNTKKAGLILNIPYPTTTINQTILYPFDNTWGIRYFPLIQSSSDENTYRTPIDTFAHPDDANYIYILKTDEEDSTIVRIIELVNPAENTQNISKFLYPINDEFRNFDEQIFQLDNKTVEGGNYYINLSPGKIKFYQDYPSEDGNTYITDLLLIYEIDIGKPIENEKTIFITSSNLSKLDLLENQTYIINVNPYLNKSPLVGHLVIFKKDGEELTFIKYDSTTTPYSEDISKTSFARPIKSLELNDGTLIFTLESDTPGFMDKLQINLLNMNLDFSSFDEQGIEYNTVFENKKYVTTFTYNDVIAGKIEHESPIKSISKHEVDSFDPEASTNDLLLLNIKFNNNEELKLSIDDGYPKRVISVDAPNDLSIAEKILDPSYYSSETIELLKNEIDGILLFKDEIWIKGEKLKQSGLADLDYILPDIYYKLDYDSNSNLGYSKDRNSYMAFNISLNMDYELRRYDAIPTVFIYIQNLTTDPKITTKILSNSEFYSTIFNDIIDNVHAYSYPSDYDGFIIIQDLEKKYVDGFAIYKLNGMANTWTQVINDNGQLYAVTNKDGYYSTFRLKKFPDENEVASQKISLTEQIQLFEKHFPEIKLDENGKIIQTINEIESINPKEKVFEVVHSSNKYKLTVPKDFTLIGTSNISNHLAEIHRANSFGYYFQDSKDNIYVFNPYYDLYSVNIYIDEKTGNYFVTNPFLDYDKYSRSVGLGNATRLYYQFNPDNRTFTSVTDIDLENLRLVKESEKLADKELVKFEEIINTDNQITEVLPEATQEATETVSNENTNQQINPTLSPTLKPQIAQTNQETNPVTESEFTETKQNIELTKELLIGATITLTLSLLGTYLLRRKRQKKDLIKTDEVVIEEFTVGLDDENIDPLEFIETEPITKKDFNLSLVLFAFVYEIVSYGLLIDKDNTENHIKSKLENISKVQKYLNENFENDELYNVLYSGTPDEINNYFDNIDDDWLKNTLKQIGFGLRMFNSKSLKDSSTQLKDFIQNKNFVPSRVSVLRNILHSDDIILLLEQSGIDIEIIEDLIKTLKI